MYVLNDMLVDELTPLAPVDNMSARASFYIPFP